MHILALIIGGWLNFVGDVSMCVVGGVITRGVKGYVYDQCYDYPSRRAAAFELFPIPVGLALAGLILARWGYVGL